MKLLFVTAQLRATAIREYVSIHEAKCSLL